MEKKKLITDVILAQDAAEYDWKPIKEKKKS